MFTVDIRTTCKVCHAPIDKTANKRLRSYCSKTCRDKFHNDKMQESGYSREYQLQKYNQKAVYGSDKKKCGICDRWYRKVASHVFMQHHLTAYEYKRHMDLPTTKGILTDDKRELLRDHALYYGMDKQLIRTGVRTRFVRGGKKQRGKKPHAGKKFEHNDYF